jgi:hypothetical protein
VFRGRQRVGQGRNTERQRTPERVAYARSNAPAKAFQDEEEVRSGRTAVRAHAQRHSSQQTNAAEQPSRERIGSGRSSLTAKLSALPHGWSFERAIPVEEKLTEGFQPKLATTASNVNGFYIFLAFRRFS